jgi:hypothetical protein
MARPRNTESHAFTSGALVVATTALGVVQNALTQLLQGKDPESQWKNNPLAAFGNAMLRGSGM